MGQQEPICKLTGEFAVRGSCPVHNGDACLVVLNPELADKIQQYKDVLWRVALSEHCDPALVEAATQTLQLPKIEQGPGIPIWDGSRNVHHRRMDHDHELLFNYFHKYVYLGSKGNIGNNLKQELSDLVREAISVARQHFAYEEMKMVHSGYDPFLREAHVEDHKFIQNAMLRAINAGDIEVPAKEFDTYFFRHIITFDKPLAEWLNNTYSIEE